MIYYIELLNLNFLKQYFNKFKITLRLYAEMRNGVRIIPQNEIEWSYIENIKNYGDLYYPEFTSFV